MSTPSNSPDPEREDRGAVVPEETESDDRVVARRAPRYARFIVLGIVVFAFAALIVTYAVPARANESRLAVLGYMILVAVAVGAAVGALVAFVADWVTRRRTRTVAAKRYEASAEDVVMDVLDEEDDDGGGSTP